jgi:hypothetical protein
VDHGICGTEISVFTATVLVKCVEKCVERCGKVEDWFNVHILR